MASIVKSSEVFDREKNPNLSPSAEDILDNEKIEKKKYLPMVEDLPNDWTCSECGNDKVSSEWIEDADNVQLFRCSECGEKVAKRYW